MSVVGSDDDATEPLFCGEPMCKQRVATTIEVERWPLQCPSCGATVYPVDDLRAGEWSKVDTNRTVAMVERGTKRVPYPMNGRVKVPDPDPDLESILRLVDDARRTEGEATSSSRAGHSASPRTTPALNQVVVQVRVDSWGDRTDLDLRYAIEDEIGRCLMEEDLGHSDGGDIGSGTINAFFFVGDAPRAVQRMVSVLKTLGLAGAATIAVRTEQGAHEVWYPKGESSFAL